MNNYWYSSGLQFECVGCGNCCAGPQEGYIWISRPEIEFLAGHLGVAAGEVKQQYLKRYGLRHSIKEDPMTKDCIFLILSKNGCRGCAVYPVRPNQCRTWPFWDDNLSSRGMWDIVATRCLGMNNGRFYSFEEIEQIRTQKTWWEK